jgi:hypothetical protein
MNINEVEHSEADPLIAGQTIGEMHLGSIETFLHYLELLQRLVPISAVDGVFWRC